MTHDHTKNPVHKQIQALLGDLATLKDDLKVQAKLGTMELRDRGNALQKRHDALHDTLRDARDEAVEGLRGLVSALRNDVTRLRADAGIDPKR